MNKAKMTFRFDHDPGRRRSGAERTGKERQANIIPLNSEEYRVMDEQQPKQSESSLPHNTDFPVTPASLKETASPSPLIDGQTLNQYTTDFGGWQSSFDIETQRVEKLIRDSGGSTIPHDTTLRPDSGHLDRRAAHDDDEGIISEQMPDDPATREPLRDHRWYVPEQTAYITKRPGTSWIKIVTSVTGAIITGVAFGFFVLSMFSDDSKGTQNNKPSTQTPSIAASTSPSNDKTTSATGAKAASANGNTAAASTATAVVNIPAKTYSFLQNGVFSSAQSAEAAQTLLKKQGFGAVSEAGDKYTVYVGMGLTKDEAQSMAQQFQQKKIDVMVKNVDLPSLNKIKWSGKPSEAFASYINQGDKLLGLIAPQAAAHLSETKSSPISDSAIQSIKTAHQTWTGMTAAATEGLTEDARAAVQKMNSALNTAVVSLDEYKKNPAPSFIWQTQTAMMQYIISQKELRKAVAAQ